MLDPGGKRGILARTPGFLCRAFARQRGDDVGGIDAGFHPARDVVPDPHPPVVADPALVDARCEFLRHAKNLSSSGRTPGPIAAVLSVKGGGATVGGGLEKAVVMGPRACAGTTMEG